MSKLKRIFSIIFVAVMIISTFSFTITAVAAKTYDDEIQFVTDLGITGFDKSTQAQAITRGEFAVAVAQAIGMDTTYTAKETFTDVPSTHTSYNAVSYLYENSIVAGYGDGSFKPDQTINYEEALKTLSCALGYEAYAQAAGGYSVGYRKVAEQFNLTLNPSDITSLTKGETVALIYKLLHTNYLEINSVTDNGKVTFHASEETVMQRVFDLEKKTGIVTATKLLTVYGENAEEENVIFIDYVRHKTTLKKINDFVGCKVEYYVDKDRNVYSIIKDRNVQIYEIKSKYITSNSTGINICYEDDNGRKKDLKVFGNADYVYNGRPVSGSEAEKHIKPDYGELKLIDNNSDKYIDVVIIWDYTPYYVEKVSSTTFKLVNRLYNSKTGKYDNLSKSVSFSDGNKTLVFISNKRFMDSLLFAADSMANYAESLDGTHRTVFTIQNMIEGTINAVNSTDNTMIIDEDEYDMVPGLYYSDYLGKRKEIYLDSNGYVGYIKGFSGDRYGVIKEGYYKDFEGELGLRLYNEEGFKEYIMSEKDKINFGVGSVTDRLLIGDIWNKFYQNGVFTKTFVKYTLSEDGTKIASIVFPEDISGGDYMSKIDEDRFQKCYSVGDTSGNDGVSYYRKKMTVTLNGIQETTIYVDSTETKVITMSDDDDFCNFMGLKKFLSSSESATWQVPVTIYNTKKTGWSEFVFLDTNKKVEQTWAAKADNGLIMSVKKVYDSEKDIVKNVYEIYRYTNSYGSSIVSVSVSDDKLKNIQPDGFNTMTGYENNTNVFDDLRVGDTIMYLEDALTGEISLWGYWLKREDFLSGKSNNRWQYGAGLVFNANYGEIKEIDELAVLIGDPVGTPDGEGIENPIFPNKDMGVWQRSDMTSNSDTSRMRTLVVAYSRSNDKFDTNKYTWEDLSPGMKIWCLNCQDYEFGCRMVIVMED